MTEIKLQHAVSARVGSFILFEGVPHIVKEIQTSKPGKHGHAKVRIKATDIFTGRSKEVVKPGHDNIEVPILKKFNAQILSITSGNIELMDMETFETISSDVSLADENLREKLKAGQSVNVWGIVGKNIIKQILSEA